MSHQFDLTDDQLQIQDMARKFTADAITPFAAEWDEQHVFPRDTIRMAAELGFGAIYVSEESGGIGLGRLEAEEVLDPAPQRLGQGEGRRGRRDEATGLDRAHPGPREAGMPGQLPLRPAPQEAAVPEARLERSRLRHDSSNVRHDCSGAFPPV